MRSAPPVSSAVQARPRPRCCSRHACAGASTRCSRSFAGGKLLREGFIISPSSMLSALPQDRRSMLFQLARFIVSGAIVTALGVGVYAIVALVLRWHPQLGNFLAYAIAVAT